MQLKSDEIVYQFNVSPDTETINIVRYGNKNTGNNNIEDSSTNHICLVLRYNNNFYNLYQEINGKKYYKFSVIDNEFPGEGKSGLYLKIVTGENSIGKLIQYHARTLKNKIPEAISAAQAAEEKKKREDDEKQRLDQIALDTENQKRLKQEAIAEERRKQKFTRLRERDKQKKAGKDTRESIISTQFTTDRRLSPKQQRREGKKAA